MSRSQILPRIRYIKVILNRIISNWFTERINLVGLYSHHWFLGVLQIFILAQNINRNIGKICNKITPSVEQNWIMSWKVFTSMEDYISWSFGITPLILGCFTYTLLLKDLWKCVSIIAFIITAEKQAQARVMLLQRKIGLRPQYLLLTEPRRCFCCGLV